MNKHELNEKLFDEILKYAAANYVDEAETQWPSDEELSARYTFSETFNKKMHQLIDEQKRREETANLKRTAVKIATAVLILFTVSIVTVMNVDALRVRMMNYLSKRNEISTIFSIIGNNENFSETQNLPLPKYLPSGYSMASFETNDDFCIVVYKDHANNEIFLQKLPIGFTAGVDSEDAYTEDLMVNKQPAEYFKKNNTGTLIYKYNKELFLLNAPLLKNELIKIAQSME